MHRVVMASFLDLAAGSSRSIVLSSDCKKRRGSKWFSKLTVDLDGKEELSERVRS